MIFSLLITLLVLFLVLMNNYFIKSIFYPPFVFTFIWFIILFVYFLLKLFNLVSIEELHSKTLLLLLLANLMFSAGGLYCIFYRRNLGDKFINFKPTKIPKIFEDIFLLISIGGLFLLFQEAMNIASKVESQNVLISLRYQLTVKRLDYGILKYFLVFGLFNSLYRFLTFSKFNELKKSQKARLIISIIVSLVLLILSTGRTYILFYFTTILLIQFFKGNLIFKDVRMFILLSLIGFIGLGIILNKGGSITYSLSENLKSSFHHIIAYMEGPVLAFDKFFNSEFEYTYGKNTLRFFYAILFKMGLIAIPPVDIVHEYVYVPYPTNVYTLFYEYIMDFGFLITLLMVFFLGVIHTWLYLTSRISGNFLKIISAFSYYPLIMIFFQDQYFSLMSFWLQLFIYSFIVFICFSKVKC